MLKKIIGLLCASLLILGCVKGPALSAGVPATPNPFDSIDQAREKALASAKAPRSRQQEDPKALRTRKSQQAAQGLAPRQPRYIVKFKDSISLQDIYDGIKSHPFTVIGNSSLRTFTIETDNIEAVRSAFGDKIRFVEEDARIKVDSVTTDKLVDEQWALPALKIPEAWAKTKGSDTVYVAVIDSGVNPLHEDLASADIRLGRNFLYGGSVDFDTAGHGTSVTGIIAATANNGIGIAGVCWNVAILPYLVIDFDGTGTLDDICSAIYEAADAGSDVINLSLGSAYSSAAEEDAIDYALSKGCIVVGAAGNDGGTSYLYPASLDGVVSAAAVNSSLNVSSFSQRNNRVDVAAPGENVWSTIDPLSNNGHQYESVSGTSFAAPYVAGIAALARSLDNGIDSYEFEDILRRTATDKGPAGYDNAYGYGIANAQAVLNLISKSGNANLSGITASDGTLSPAFDPGVLNYDLYVDDTLPTVKLAVGKQDSGSAVKINGVAGTSASVPVSEGATVSIEVTSADRKVKTYKLTLHLIYTGITARNMSGAAIGNRGCSGTDVTVSINSSVVASASVTLNNTALAWPANGRFASEGKYVIRAARMDGLLYTFTFSIDRTPPVVTVKTVAGTAVTNNAVVTGDVIVAITEANIKSKTAYRNGAKYEWPAGGKFSPGATITAYTIEVWDAANAHATFKFTLKPVTYAITATACNTAYGSVTGGGSIAKGTTATLRATPRAGYRFARWLEGTTAVSTAWEFKFTVTKARTLKAEFARIGAPVIKTASSGYSSVKLTWAAVAGAKEYEIYRASSSGGTYSKVGTTIATSYTNGSLIAGMTYYYKVRVKCVAGSTTTYGSYSSIVSARPIPATPTVKAASTSCSSAKLSWGAVAGAAKYEVYRASSSTGAYTKLATTAYASYTSTGLTAGRTYYYKVRAYRLVGSAKVYGSYSSVVSIKPMPAAPTGAKAFRVSSTRIKVTWGAVSGVTKYEVYRATSSTGTYTKLTTTASTSYTDTGLSAGKTYYYKVRAYRLVVSTKVYGIYSAVVSMKP